MSDKRHEDNPAAKFKKKKFFISIAGFPKEKEVGVKVEKEIIFILKILNPSLLFMCHSLLGYLRLTIIDIKHAALVMTLG